MLDSLVITISAIITHDVMQHCKEDGIVNEAVVLNALQKQYKAVESSLLHKNKSLDEIMSILSDDTLATMIVHHLNKQSRSSLELF